MSLKGKATLILNFVGVAATLAAGACLGQQFGQSKPRSGEPTSAASATPAIAAQNRSNTLGIEMVNIPAGSFMMGSCTQAAARAGQRCDLPDADVEDNETPMHRVHISAFQLGKYPVTLGQFKQYTAAAGRSSLVTDDFMKYNSHGDNAPVVIISWDDAQAFIAWLNRQDGGGWHLPSEAQWEYACRAGSRHIYCGSNNLYEVGWYDGNSGKRQHPVGGKRANAFGLHDMSGNVMEWVQDCWHDNYTGAPTDGSAWETGCSRDVRVRVLRGGSWNYFAWLTRAAYRDNHTQGSRHNNIGFRLARTR